MHIYNFLCSDSLLYFFLFLSTLHSVYTRDCSLHTQGVFNAVLTDVPAGCIGGIWGLLGGDICSSHSLQPHNQSAQRGPAQGKTVGREREGKGDHCPTV